MGLAAAWSARLSAEPSAARVGRDGFLGWVEDDRTFFAYAYSTESTISFRLTSIPSISPGQEGQDGDARSRILPSKGRSLYRSSLSFPLAPISKVFD
jgi:hypothetical protein